MKTRKSTLGILAAVLVGFVIWHQWVAVFAFLCGARSLHGVYQDGSRLYTVYVEDGHFARSGYCWDRNGKRHELTERQAFEFFYDCAGPCGD